MTIHLISVLCLCGSKMQCVQQANLTMCSEGSSILSTVDIAKSNNSMYLIFFTGIWTLYIFPGLLLKFPSENMYTICFRVGVSKFSFERKLNKHTNIIY